MSIVSVNQIERYTPPGADPDTPPVYLITPPSLMTRAKFLRAVTAAGARFATDDQLIDAMRRGVTEMVAEEDRAPMFALIDQWEEVEKTIAYLEADKAPGNEIDAAKADREKLAGRMRFFEGEMQDYPLYAQKLSQRQYWMEIAPLLAAQHFLTGWESVDMEFRRENGLVPIGVLDELARLSPGHVQLIGFRAIAMGNASKADEKNSEGASVSSASRKRSRPIRKAPGRASAKI